MLDTTGSMGGLIAGAKKKIWSIANEIADNDPNAIVRMGLIGFRDIGDIYVTKFFDLTEDIDGLYGKLIGFQASGGGDAPESVNQALYEAVTRATWTSYGEDTIRLVFLAGDSPPHMDYQHDVKYPETLVKAKQRGITVHALQAGRRSATQRVWKEIAALGEGIYAQIPQSGNVQVITTPFDEQIHRLQQKMRGTVIPYGQQHTRAAYDKKLSGLGGSAISMGISAEGLAASSADRAAYRAKKRGKREVITGGGDLLAEIEAGTVNIDKLDDEKLPKKLRSKAAEERKALISKRMAERKEIDGQLDGLLKKRGQFLKNNKPKQRHADSFDEKIREGIRLAF
ncbi:MAG: VWA domain-containing protein [Alphaproteobacteria bacterium]|nr:VWA domain-containing protein [Alphaproteobacteria bacterium]